MMIALVDVLDIFYFFCSGERKEESEAPGGGVGSVFHCKSWAGGGFQGEGKGGVARGREGVCREFLGGGANYFLGAEIPTK